MRRPMKTTRNWTVCFAAVASAGALFAGCGGGDDSTPSATKSEATAAATTAATPDAAAALGTENKATGSPITLGMLNLESGPVAFPEYSAAAKAAVAYINDYKGGIGGHPIQLDVCAT